ncbi:phosphatase PAP2 family protein [Pelotalea chapellei]|uniref:Phosphatase PAP2 family protein n=1 Tax=Pelotalea chapellei TaxID=44671 RepID=A0ABS5U6R8_9BACT|nr:phosphatase PAP2 family protein [Pelotalea chapellei]MBT1071358.1 phosphatase PAP2 family protein [Pelotalea chapellei]
MERSAWYEAIVITAVLVALTAIIALSGLDLMISSHFYTAGNWPVGEQFPWKLLYRIDRIPALFLAVAGLWMATPALLKPARWSRKACSGVFLVLLLALGPGLLVNVVFKEGWGRPRPRDIVQFSGSKTYLEPWQKGTMGQGRSFPSGHASAAFYMSSPFFIYRRRRPCLARVWLAGGICFGILMSIARITQGGHFLSDTVWAFGMVYLTGLALSVIMGLNKEDRTTT